MSLNFRGNSELLKELERHLGVQRIQQISDRALLAGANVFVRELKHQFETFKDKGESIKEITISQPTTVRGARTVKIHWRGPKGRYRIIHLNEWGTVNNPNPRGKGAIAKAMRNAADMYREIIKREIRRGL